MASVLAVLVLFRAALEPSRSGEIWCDAPMCVLFALDLQNLAFAVAEFRYSALSRLTVAAAPGQFVGRIVLECDHTHSCSETGDEVKPVQAVIITRVIVLPRKTHVALLFAAQDRVGVTRSRFFTEHVPVSG